MPATIPRQTPCRKCPLKALEIFRAISPGELSFIEEFKSGEFVTDPGATILMEGTSNPHLFTVLSGWAFRYKTLEDGRRQILNFVFPGDFLGLQSSTFNEMQHSVEALSQMVLCVFPRDKLWDLYAKHPALAYDLTWLASRSERLLDEQLLTIGRRTAIEKMGCVLLDIFARARHVGLVTGAKLKLPITQQHLADALGLSLVHTNKTLNKLVSQRLVKWQSSTLEILDEAKLARISGYEGAGPVLRPLI